MFRVPPKEREWVSWLGVGLWTIVIYLTIPFARILQKTVANRFGGKQIFTWIVISVVVGATVGLITYVIRVHRKEAWKRLIYLMLVGAVFVYRTLELRDAPVEAVHFLEYAFLGVLLYRAFVHRLRDPMVYVAAILAGSMIGTLDEAIQWMVPRRWWDWRDVWFNASSVLLMQMAILLGLTPAIIRKSVRAGSIRIVCRLAAGTLILCMLCLANRPDRVAWYCERVPGLGFLKGNESVMAEYGYLYRDPAIGRFKSRLSKETLRKQDQERGKEAAAILDKYRHPGAYDGCLIAYPSHVDPLIYEARIHLHSMMHHLGILWPKSWDVPMVEDMHPEKRQDHALRAYREYLIMTRYFPVTFDNAHYKPRDSQIEALRQTAPEEAYYNSKVSRELFTFVPEVVLRGILIMASILAIGIDIGLKSWQKQTSR